MGGSDHCYLFGCISDRRCPHSKKYWRKTCRNWKCTFCKTKIVVLLWENKQIWPRFFLANILKIIGRGWAKYGDLSVASRSIIIVYLLICETLTNHDILGYPSSIIVLSFDHQVCFLMNIFGKRSHLPFFTQEWSQNTRDSWTTLRMGRTLFVGSYLQVTMWTFGQWKGRKICNEW